GAVLQEIAEGEQDHERAGGQAHLLPREVEERRAGLVPPNQDEDSLGADGDADQGDQGRGREQPATPDRDVDPVRVRIEGKERPEGRRQAGEREEQPPRSGSFHDDPGYPAAAPSPQAGGDRRSMGAVTPSSLLRSSSSPRPRARRTLRGARGRSPFGRGDCKKRWVAGTLG